MATTAQDDQGTQSSGSGTTPNTIQSQSGTNSSGTTVAGKAGDSPPSKEAPGKRLQNPLSNFSSYTYNISLYMITTDAYDAFLSSGRRNINALADQGSGGAGAYIVAQSGGINNQSSARAPGFDLDYYIDDLKIVSSTSGQSSGSETNITEFKFTITEPYGFSFLSKLKQTADALQAYSKAKGYTDLSNPTRQFFILGLSFTGYDKDGKILTSASQFDNSTFDPGGSSNGIFERFFDIVIKDIKFKLDGKASTYHVSAASKAPQTAFNIKKGLITRGATVIGKSVLDTLTGPDGLITRLNADQQASLNEGAISEKTNYNVRFIGDSDSIKNASIVSKADLDKHRWPMSDGIRKQDINPALEVKAAPDPNKRQIVFKDGTPVLQAVSQIISQSSYLENALKVLYTTATEPNPKTNSDDEEKGKDNSIRWFNIGAVVKNARWDTKTGDFAYDITYVIQPYETPVVMSAYANKAIRYYGPYKRYEYWYTGKNSEIINYEQTLDNTVFNVAIAPNLGDSASQGGATDVPVVPNMRQPTNRLGRQGVGMEAQNSYRTFLIDPNNQAHAKITILGDPDFLMQDSPGDETSLYSQFYGQDGFTINANGGQVFIEINFYEAQDYDNQTGVLKINEKILFWKLPEDVLKELDSRGGGISYRLITVTSMFRAGKFTQELSCAINTFGDGTNDASKAREATTSNQSAAETARLGLGTASNTADNTSQSKGLIPAPTDQTTAETARLTGSTIAGADQSTAETARLGLGSQITTNTGGSPNSGAIVASDDASGSSTPNSTDYSNEGRAR